MKCGFPRSARLSGRDQIKRLFREGKTIRSSGSLLLVARPNRCARTRFGCSVRREAAAGPAARNRLKRWLREAFRRNKERFPSGWDLFAVLLRAREKPTFQSLQEELIALAKRVRS